MWKWHPIPLDGCDGDDYDGVDYGNDIDVDIGDDAKLLWRNVWSNPVLNLFWQMCALSACWVSYLKWQTFWCHMSVKHRFVRILPLLLYFLLACLIFSKIRAATKASACNPLTGDSKLVFASTGSRLLDQKERKWKLREVRLDKPARLRFWDECGDPLRAAVKKVMAK